MTLAGALVLMFFTSLLLLYILMLRRGFVPSLRPIAAYDALRGLMGRAIETGRALHLSLGTGGISTEVTADGLAGLELLDYLSEQAAASGVFPIVTMSDPSMLPAAQNVVQRACGDDEGMARLAETRVRWVAPSSAPYAAAVMDLLRGHNVDANVMLGAFGDEYLLMGESAARQGISHIGGSSSPDVLPFVYASADEVLIGEEMYAAGAYLGRKRSHVASILAQDALRWFIITFILAMVFFKSIGII